MSATLAQQLVDEERLAKERWLTFLKTATPRAILENYMRAEHVAAENRIRCAIALLQSPEEPAKAPADQP